MRRVFDAILYVVKTVTEGIWAMDDGVFALSAHETASKLGFGC